MKPFSTIAFVLSLTSVFAQNVAWENVNPNNLTLGKYVAVDNANNIISVGNGFNQAGFAEFIYIQKIDTAGNTLWIDSISSGIPNNYQAATWVGTDANNNIFVVGYQFTLSLQNEIPNALKVLKYSPAGVFLSGNTIAGSFGSGANYNLGNNNEAFLDENNNLYIATAGITSSLLQAGLVLLKLDNNCTVIWERVKNFSSVHALKGMSYNNGTIALAGNTTFALTENKVAVWDSLGNLLWFSNNALPDQSWATDILVDANGNTYTLCQKFGAVNTEIELTKYTSSGTVSYRQAYNIGTEATSGRMEFLPDGSVVLSGTNWSVSGIGKLFVAHVAANGTLIDSSSHVLPNINNWVYDLKVGASGTYYIAGKSDNNGGAPATMFLYAFYNNGALAWQTTYNAQGTIPMALALDTDENVNTSIQNKNAVVKFSNSIPFGLDEEADGEITTVYPNPFTDFITIKLNSGQIPATAFVYDLTGKLVLQTELNRLETELNLSLFKSGIYLCRIQPNHNDAFYVKLVKP